MRRGDVCLAVIQGDFGKPRPVVIVQADLLNEVHSSTIVCPFTSHEREVANVRIAVDPDAENGLDQRSFLMVDRLLSLRWSKLRVSLGRLGRDELIELDRGIAFVLGLG